MFYLKFDLQVGKLQKYKNILSITIKTLSLLATLDACKAVGDGEKPPLSVIVDIAVDSFISAK